MGLVLPPTYQQNQSGGVMGAGGSLRGQPVVLHGNGMQNILVPSNRASVGGTAAMQQPSMQLTRNNTVGPKEARYPLQPSHSATRYA